MTANVAICVWQLVLIGVMTAATASSCGLCFVARPSL